MEEECRGGCFRYSVCWRTRYRRQQIRKNGGQQTYSYAYDRYSNRWQQNSNSSYTFNNNNQIAGSGVVYDAAGNITADAGRAVDEITASSWIWGDAGMATQRSLIEGVVSGPAAAAN